MTSTTRRDDKPGAVSGADKTDNGDNDDVDDVPSNTVSSG